MSSNTIYLITGANRGIGLTLTASLLLRPNIIVIATVRSPTTSTVDLTALPTAPGSKLIIEILTNDLDSSFDARKLLSTLQSTHSLTHIDTIIANAGTSSFSPILSTPISSIHQHFETNTLAPISLFQVTYPLLLASPNPKFVLISSVVGSIEQMDPSPSLAYGMSKAAANYFVKKVHLECERIAAVAIHPGWLKTENGQNFADSVGVKEPPKTPEDNVEGILNQIDTATKTTTSGCFVNYDGAIIPW